MTRNRLCISVSSGLDQPTTRYERRPVPGTICFAFHVIICVEIPVNTELSELDKWSVWKNYSLPTAGENPYERVAEAARKKTREELAKRSASGNSKKNSSASLSAASGGGGASSDEAPAWCCIFHTVPDRSAAVAAPNLAVGTAAPVTGRITDVSLQPIVPRTTEVAAIASTETAPLALSALVVDPTHTSKQNRPHTSPAPAPAPAGSSGPSGDTGHQNTNSDVCSNRTLQPPVCPVVHPSLVLQ